MKKSLRQLDDDLATDLTPKQEAVLDFITDHIERGERPPTRVEIAAHLDIWTSSADDIVKALVKKKRLKVAYDIPRGIRLSEEWRLADR